MAQIVAVAAAAAAAACSPSGGISNSEEMSNTLEVINVSPHTLLTSSLSVFIQIRKQVSIPLLPFLASVQSSSSGSGSGSRRRRRLRG